MKQILLSAVVVIVLLAACASPPELVPPPDELYDEVKSLRSRIDEKNLAEYAQSEYDVGEAYFADGETAYNAEEYESAGQLFSDAKVQYTEVIRKGFQSVSSARKSEADSYKSQADEIKASVAVAEDYSAAKAVYDQAVAAANSGDDETAAELFENASTLFKQVYEAAAVKKSLAEDALAKIDQSIDDLDAQREKLENEAREDLEASGEGSE